MGIGTKTVCHISFVVKDIDKTVENWAAFLGIDMPRIWNIPKPEEAPALTDGKLEDYSDCRISVIEMDNLVLEFVQPGERTSPWKTWMEKNGEGFQHMAFVVEDREKAKQLIRNEFGVDGWYHIGYYRAEHMRSMTRKKRLQRKSILRTIRTTVRSSRSF